MRPDEPGRPEPAASGPRLSEVAFLARALSDENRLRILLAVADGRRPVTELVRETGLSQPLVSHHLRELKRALLVRVERRGPFVFYEIAGPGVIDILRDVARLAETLLAARSGF
jgi:DNA-binding transcriptional ArsR family regulator